MISTTYFHHEAKMINAMLESIYMYYGDLCGLKKIKL